MAKRGSSGLIRIKASRTPYQRAGVDLNGASWTTVVLGDVGEGRGRKLLADVNLTIQALNQDGEWETVPAAARGLAQPAAAPIDEAEVSHLRDTISQLSGEITTLENAAVSQSDLIAKLQADLAQRDVIIGLRDAAIHDLAAEVKAAAKAVKAKGGGQAQ